MTNGIDRDHGLELLRQMLRIRRFEEKCAELYSSGKIRGFLHLYIGEEAVAVGAMPALDLGGCGRRHLPRARPRAGPRHCRWDRSWRRCTARRTVRAGPRRDRCTSSTPRAASTAATRSSPAGCRSRSDSRWPTRCSNADRVTACFFGDGAVAEGEFHESPQSRRAVEAAGAVPLREQPLRDGDRARSGTNRRPTSPARPTPIACRPGRRRDGRRSRSKRPRRQPSIPFARATGRIFSSAEPTGSAPTRCTTRSSTATRPRSSNGSSVTRSRLFQPSSRAEGT